MQWSERTRQERNTKRCTERAQSQAASPRVQRAAAQVTGDRESSLVVNLQQAISLTSEHAPEDEGRETDLMKTVTKE